MSMYVVLVVSKSIEPLRAVLPPLKDQFPKEQFYIEGSEEKGYKLYISGLGDEKEPRKFVKAFLKKWKASSKSITTSTRLVACK